MMEKVDILKFKMDQIEVNMKKAKDFKGEIAKEDNVKEVQAFIRELL